MTDIGAYEAKTHLAQLLERVRQGERFTITRHGQPVAELVPVTPRKAEDVRRAVAELHAIRNQLARRGVHLEDILESDETLRDLAHGGHRY